MRVLMLLLLFSCTAFAASEPRLKPGDQPPENFAYTAAGEEIRADSYRGKIVIATFWASWCAPCRQEIGVLARLRQAVPKDKLEIVAINYGESRKMFAAASAKLAPFDLTITHDRNKRLGKWLGIRSIPYMLLIDHTGTIKHIHKGFGDSSLDVLVDEVNAMLRDQHAARLSLPAQPSS
jgi:thiol-disulfide isomerase/thioredoxin